MPDDVWSLSIVEYTGLWRAFRRIDAENEFRLARVAVYAYNGAAGYRFEPKRPARETDIFPSVAAIMGGASGAAKQTPEEMFSLMCAWAAATGGLITEDEAASHGDE